MLAQELTIRSFPNDSLLINTVIYMILCIQSKCNAPRSQSVSFQVL